ATALPAAIDTTAARTRARHTTRIGTPPRWKTPRNGYRFRNYLGRAEAPLVVPELDTAFVHANPSPIIGTHQAHQVRGRDRVATCIAHLAETAAAPKLDRVVAREAPLSESLSNLLANEVTSHSMGVLLHPLQRCAGVHRRASSRVVV